MITVREATVTDAAILVAHLQELAAGPGLNIPLGSGEIATVEQERAVLQTFEDSETAIMLIAQAEGQLVGELSLRSISPRRAVRHVATLGMSVKAGWRRKGVGKELLSAALEWAPTAGIKRVELYVYARNTDAIALYERFGFETEGRRKSFIREGDTYLDDLVMAKIL